MMLEAGGEQVGRGEEQLAGYAIAQNPVLGRADLGSPTMFAEVSAQLAVPGQAPTYYVEFVVSTTSGPSTTVDTSVCLVRSGSPDAPLATAPLALSDRLFVGPCSAEVLKQRGIRT